MSARKINSTKNYRLFERHSGENRPIDVKKHRKLVDSMRLYGFLECFPIVVNRNGNGNMIVKDGQHRLAIAETLGLPVHYVEDNKDFDVAIVNSTAKTWVLRDYAQKYVANGNSAYEEGLKFADEHGLSIGTAFALLFGTTSFSNCQEQFITGTWCIKDINWANTVAAIYSPLVQLNGALRHQRFIEACMAVCRVPKFIPDRLIENAKRCREKLINYSTKEANLDMLETIYNFGRRDLVGLKAEATMAMKNRSPLIRKEKKRHDCGSAESPAPGPQQPTPN